MDLARFSHTSAGYLVRIRGTDPRTGKNYDHRAFVPHHLPHGVDLDRRTHNAIGSAMLELGRLDEALRWVTNPSLFIRPAIRKEAVSTSALEGTVAAFEDVMGAELLDDVSDDPDLVEVLNFVAAAEQAFDLIGERPISFGLLCELQRMLVANTDSDGPEAGTLRETQVLIGPKGASVERARFIPPPPGDVLRAGMDDWLAWLEQDDDLPLLARIAIAHYQFETLHPFTDGNGRIGRLVAMLQLARASVLTHPMLTISTWLNERREEYLNHLFAISTGAGFDDWIVFFCEAVQEEAVAAVTRIRRVQAWKDRAMQTVTDSGAKGATIHRVTDGLIGHPVLTPTRIQREYGVSYPTANTTVGRLVDLGLLSEMTGRRYARVFASLDLLSIYGS